MSAIIKPTIEDILHDRYIETKIEALKQKNFLVMGTLKLYDEKVTELILSKQGKTWCVRFSHVNIQKGVKK